MNGVETHQPGDPGADGTVPLAVPTVGDLERTYVLEALDSGFVSSVGPFVTEFESRFAEYVGSRHAIACASGTAALHVALMIVRVGPGDEVACSDFTFVGSANPIYYLGATPLLVDSERISWNMDPHLLRDEVERRVQDGQALPRAVEVVHVLGQPADLVPILELCSEYGIPVIEDAAESLGARWTGGPLSGHHTGAVGTVGCFSFNGNKIATTGGGGMIVTDDDALAARARHLTTQAKVADIAYLHDEVGYNYRLTNLAAALGLAQLKQLDGFVSAKRRIGETYDHAFGALPLSVHAASPNTAPSRWLYSLLLDEADRDQVLAHLNAAGVGARPLWRPLHLQPPFADAPRLGGDVGVDLFRRGISLPCSVRLSGPDQTRVIDALTDYFD